MERNNQSDKKSNDLTEYKVEFINKQTPTSKLNSIDEFLKRSPFVQTPNR